MACTSVLIVEPRDVLCLGLASMVASNPDVGRYRCRPTFDGVVPPPNGVATNGARAAGTAWSGDGPFDVAIASVDVYARWASTQSGPASASARGPGSPASPATVAVPACRTIALIESTSMHGLEAAAQVHADGYLLLTETTVETLRAAVHDVMAGRMSLPQVLSSHLLERARRPDPLAMSRSVRLSPREEDVLALLVAGLSNKQIARHLDISIHGAKRHVSSVLNKYNAPSRSYLISQSLQLGLAKPPASLVPARRDDPDPDRSGLGGDAGEVG
jgi:DNA-binding NarL/FixJ family response regulator